MGCAVIAETVEKSRLWVTQPGPEYGNSSYFSRSCLEDDNPHLVKRDQLTSNFPTGLAHRLQPSYQLRQMLWSIHNSGIVGNSVGQGVLL